MSSSMPEPAGEAGAQRPSAMALMFPCPVCPAEPDNGCQPPATPGGAIGVHAERSWAAQHLDDPRVVPGVIADAESMLPGLDGSIHDYDRGEEAQRYRGLIGVLSDAGTLHSERLVALERLANAVRARRRWVRWEALADGSRFCPPWCVDHDSLFFTDEHGDAFTHIPVCVGRPVGRLRPDRDGELGIGEGGGMWVSAALVERADRAEPATVEVGWDVGQNHDDGSDHPTLSLTPDEAEALADAADLLRSFAAMARSGAQVTA